MKVAALNRLKPAAPGLKVEISDLVTKTTSSYDSVRKAAFAINSDLKTILRREKSQIKKALTLHIKIDIW